VAYITYKACRYKKHLRSDRDEPEPRNLLEIPKVVNEDVDFVLEDHVILEVVDAQTSVGTLHCCRDLSNAFWRYGNSSHVCWLEVVGGVGQLLLYIHVGVCEENCRWIGEVSGV
jgi:hypothetical protein